MSDAFTNLSGEGHFGNTRITQAGRIAWNTTLDIQEIRMRIERGGKTKSKYGGSVAETAFSIRPGDLLYGEKEQRFRTATRMHSSLATVNGAFRPQDSIWQIIERLEFRGVAGGQGALFHDDMDNLKIQDFAANLGGLISIFNSGTKRIRNGDLVLWTLPPTDDPLEKAYKGTKRMVLHTEPYNPSLDSLTREGIADIVYGRADKRDLDRNTPLVEAASNLQRAILQLSLNAFHVLLSSGLVTMERDRNKQIENIAAYGRDGKPFLMELARQLNLQKYVKGLTVKPNFQPYRFDGGRTLEEAIRGTTFVEETKDVIFRSPLRVPESGDRAALVGNQRAVISDVIAGVERANYFTKRRIIGQAISPANPGDRFELFLGRPNI